MDQGTDTQLSVEDLDALRAELQGLFMVSGYTIDKPRPGNILFRGEFICDLEKCFDELRSRFERHGFTPLVREDEEGISVLAIHTVFDPQPSNWRINLFLLLLTIFSTHIRRDLERNRQ